MVAPTLTPKPGHPFANATPYLKPSSPSGTKKRARVESPIDQEESSGIDHAKLELKMSFRKIIKKDQAEARKNSDEETYRNKHITRNFRYRLFFQKALLPQLTNNLTPLQIQLLNLKSGKPLTFEALKMLLIHYTRLGVDVHKIDRLAMDNPEEVHTFSPRPH